MNNTTEKTPAIYVGTYGKYNSGSLYGKWVDLTRFTDISQFYEYCRQVHKDERDPELMFQDFEHIPRCMVGESWVDGRLWNDEVLELINADETDLIGEWNEYQSDINAERHIYENIEDFFETCFHNNIMEAVRAVVYGDYRYTDDWVYFNGYGNLETVPTSRLHTVIDKDELFEWKLRKL